MGLDITKLGRRDISASIASNFHRHRLRELR
jgi:hypothetical protein